LGEGSTKKKIAWSALAVVHVGVCVCEVGVAFAMS
jgi:hypothetical protein